MGMPLPNEIRKQKDDTLKFFGKEIDKYHLIFTAQRSAFILMVIGFLIFVFLWYLKNK